MTELLTDEAINELALTHVGADDRTRSGANCRAFARAIEAAVLAKVGRAPSPEGRAEAGGWQPIESAPKDGAWLVVSHFDAQCFYWWHRARYHRGAWRTGNGVVIPSHWLFIPPHVAQRQPDPGQKWKVGDEWLPFHPQASHVTPEYRDGWNRAYWMAEARNAASPDVSSGSSASRLVRSWDGERLTDDQIKTIFNAMPGGAQGFCREWGYLQFARAIEDAFLGDAREDGWTRLRREHIRRQPEAWAAARAVLGTAGVPDPDGERGMKWWNGLTDEGRSFWLKLSLGDRPADAWAYFKRCGAAGVKTHPDCIEFGCAKKVVGERQCDKECRHG